MHEVHIEAEGGELILKSSEGYYVIVPAKHRQEVLDMIKEGCDACINNYVKTLPRINEFIKDTKTDKIIKIK